MPWKVKDVMEQRIQFVVRALQKQSSVTQLSKEYGINLADGVSVVESVPGDRNVFVAW